MWSALDSQRGVVKPPRGPEPSAKLPGRVGVQIIGIPINFKKNCLAVASEVMVPHVQEAQRTQTRQPAKQTAMISTPPSAEQRCLGCVGIIIQSAQPEAADVIWATIIQLSAAVRKRTGSSSPLLAAAIIRLAISLRTSGSAPP
jgi:hypothetical protein